MEKKKIEYCHKCGKIKRYGYCPVHDREQYLERKRMLKPIPQ